MVIAYVNSIALSGLLALAPLAALERYEAAEPHMGALFRIVLYAPSEARASDAFRAAWQRIAELDHKLSDYNTESELMRLCATSGGVVSHDLWTVLRAASRLASETGGAFDVTEGAVIRLWRERKPPEPAALEAAARRTGYHRLKLDPRTRTVRLDPGVLLDLGGIAKGYAADEALATLRAHGIRRALVAASGDIACGDPPPGSKGWSIGIETLGVRRTLTLHNAAVSTSGDSEQFFEHQGVRYSHIIDPRTHRALTARIGVTVVARRGIDADSLATAVSVLGPDRGLEFVERRTDAAALIVTPERVLVSRRMP